MKSSANCCKKAFAALGLMLGLFSLAFLTSCAVGPNYRRPAVNVPENFRSAAIPHPTHSFGDRPSGHVFDDKTRRAAIRVAFTSNYDLRIAMARVQQARAVLQQNRGLFFPQINYGAAISRSKNAVGTQPAFNQGATVDSFSVDGNALWEIDLWGRIRR